MILLISARHIEILEWIQLLGANVPTFELFLSAINTYQTFLKAIWYMGICFHNLLPLAENFGNCSPNKWKLIRLGISILQYPIKTKPNILLYPSFHSENLVLRWPSEKQNIHRHYSKSCIVNGDRQMAALKGNTLVLNLAKKYAA